MSLNIHNANTDNLDIAVGDVISAHQDREYGRAIALGTILGFAKFHFTQKQLDGLTSALTKVAEATNTIKEAA